MTLNEGEAIIVNGSITVQNLTVTTNGTAPLVIAESASLGGGVLAVILTSPLEDGDFVPVFQAPSFGGEFGSVVVTYQQKQPHCQDISGSPYQNGDSFGVLLYVPLPCRRNSSHNSTFSDR